MDVIGSIPQWITAAIASGALYAAYLSIENQKEIARKRAAMDFFTKTEMDKHTLDAHKNFTNAVESLKAHLAKERSLDEFSETDAYWDIRDYLNLHELMGVGINQNVFDENVCYEFWSGELSRATKETGILIDYIQSRPDGKNTYIELQKVQKRWSKRDDRTPINTEFMSRRKYGS